MRRDSSARPDRTAGFLLDWGGHDTASLQLTSCHLNVCHPKAEPGIACSARRVDPSVDCETSGLKADSFGRSLSITSQPYVTDSTAWVPTSLEDVCSISHAIFSGPLRRLMADPDTPQPVNELPEMDRRKFVKAGTSSLAFAWVGACVFGFRHLSPNVKWRRHPNCHNSAGWREH